jgi:Icc-related predicted phosphoesterase
MRVAAIADLHCTRDSQGAFQPLFASVNESADLLLIAGDLTDHGLVAEAQVLVRELNSLRRPVVAVLGNHDVESGTEVDVRQVMTDAGVIVLDGEACEVAGVGIAGVKGFGGGFGPRALAPWGEAIVKQFVRETIDEALKLETALARLRTEYRIALLHYSPVPQTVEGEPLEIYPFLGSSRGLRFAFRIGWEKCIAAIASSTSFLAPVMASPASMTVGSSIQWKTRSSGRACGCAQQKK